MSLVLPGQLERVQLVFLRNDAVSEHELPVSVDDQVDETVGPLVDDGQPVLRPRLVGQVHPVDVADDADEVQFEVRGRPRRGPEDDLALELEGGRKPSPEQEALDLDERQPDEIELAGAVGEGARHLVVDVLRVAEDALDVVLDDEHVLDDELLALAQSLELALPTETVFAEEVVEFPLAQLLRLRLDLLQVRNDLLQADQELALLGLRLRALDVHHHFDFGGRVVDGDSRPRELVPHLRVFDDALEFAQRFLVQQVEALAGLRGDHVAQVREHLVALQVQGLRQSRLRFFGNYCLRFF